MVGRHTLALLRVGVGGVFLWAGVVKAWDPAAFMLEVQGYQMLPYKLGMAVALYLPWLEIVAGLSMAVGRWGRDGALLVGGVLLTGFTIALAAAWVRGLDVSCGCFGSHGGEAGRYGLWIGRDLALLAAIGVVWVGQRRVSKVSRETGT